MVKKINKIYRIDLNKISCYEFMGNKNLIKKTLKGIFA